MTLAGSDKTYNGSASYITATASVAGKVYYGTTSATSGMSTAVSVSANTATNLTSITNAGTLTVYAYFVPTDTTNYNSLGSSSNDHASKSITISKATPTMTLTGASKTYDGNTYYVSAKASVAGTVYYGTTSATSGMTSTKSVSANTSANLTGRKDYGTTTVYAYFVPTDTTNYNSLGSSSNDHTSASVTISKATGYLTATVNTPLTYSGSAQTIATISTNSGSYYFGFGSSTTSAPTTWGTANKALTTTNAGTYYVWAKCDAATNYNAVSQKYIGTVVINKATPTLTLSGSSVTYGTTATVTGKASVAGTIYYGTSSSMGSSKSATANTEYTLATRTDAGTTTVYAAFVPTDTTNYSSLGSSSSYNKSASANVNAASSTLTLTANTKTYNGTTYYVSATSTLTGTVYYGTSSSSMTNTKSITAGGTVTLDASGCGRSSVGSTTIYAYLDPTSSNYSNSSTVNAKVTINKANGSITFSPANKSVQCKNSSTQMTAVDVVTCTSATNATGTVSYTLNTGSTTLSNCSLSGTKLTVPTNTAVGDYTISITATSAATTNYKEASQTSTFTLSVLADTLESGYSGTLSINSSADLSAGADTRTITWGAIYQTWTNGKGKYYPSNTAYLEISCNNSTAGGYMSINKSSYTNSSSTTTSTLTKTSFDIKELSASTLTITLKDYNSNIVETLTVGVSQNVKTLVSETILSYGTPSISIGSGITASSSSATVTCSVQDTVVYSYEYTSGKTSSNTGKTGTASWKIYSQSCVGGTNRFSKPTSTTLSHMTMGISEGTDTVTLIAQNDNDTSKTKTVSTSANNYKRHQLTSLSLSYNEIRYNELTNTPTVTYSTSYDYLSGATGGTTSNQTATQIGTGTTLSKTFKVTSSNSSASLNTSSGVVTWTGNNTSSSARSCTIQCTGTLSSNGTTTQGTASASATQGFAGIGVTIGVFNIPSGVTLYMSANSTTSQLSAGDDRTVNITSMGSSVIAFYVTKNSSGASRTLSVGYSGGGANSVSFSPSSKSVTIPSGVNTTSTTAYRITMTIVRSSTSDVGGYSVSVGLS